MTSGKKFVAVVTDSPALGSIIAMVLADEERLGVQQFNDADALLTHMRIVPLDLLVVDYHLEGTSAAQLVLDLRRDLPQRRFETLVLTGRVTPQVKLACKFARIDEVIIKPMSPAFLKERVLSRLRVRNVDREGFGGHGNEVVTPRNPNWPDNVVPLFGGGRNSTPPPNQPRPA